MSFHLAAVGRRRRHDGWKAGEFIREATYYGYPASEVGCHFF